jgi:hypothetical protein
VQFTPDDGDVSPTAEWMARVTPFLAADDPHQQCHAKARALGVNDVNLVCACPAPPCTKDCCR